jgi:hypothetical protein
MYPAFFHDEQHRLPERERHPPQSLLLNAIINSGENHRNFFRQIDRTEYHNLRETCRNLASNLPAFIPGARPNAPAAAAAEEVWWECNNMRMTKRVLTRSSFQHIPEPRTQHMFKRPSADRQRCSHNKNHLPPTRWLDNNLGGLVRSFGEDHGEQQVNTCQWTRLGPNRDAKGQPFHEPNFLVCRSDAVTNWHNEVYAGVQWGHIGKHMVPLCFDCSLLKQNLEEPTIDGTRRFVSYCHCHEDTQPGRDASDRHPDLHNRAAWLCDECRAEWLRQKLVSWVQRLQRDGMPMRDPSCDDPGFQGLRRYVHDGDRITRNHCFCGKTYPEIKASYPLLHAAHVNDPIFRSTRGCEPAYEFCVRECLECGGHVIRATNKVNPRSWVNGGASPIGYSPP